MKTIIAGSRSIKNYKLVKDIIEYSGFEFTITEVISGTAEGVDTLGERFANERGIPITQFPAQWERYGIKGAPQRDMAMVKYADQLIAIWDGESPGTARTIEYAKQQDLRFFVYRLSDYEREISTSD